MQSYLWDMNYDWAEEKGTAWYRSKEPQLPPWTPGGNCGYLGNKKWPLIEVHHTNNNIILDMSFLNFIYALFTTN